MEYQLMQTKRGDFYIYKNDKFYINTKAKNKHEADMILRSIQDQDVQAMMERDGTADWDIEGGI